MIIADLNFLDNAPTVSEVIGGGKTLGKNIRTPYAGVAWSLSWDVGSKPGGGGVSADADAKGTGDLNTARTNTDAKSSPTYRTGVATGVATGVKLGGDATADTSAKVGFF